MTVRLTPDYQAVDAAGLPPRARPRYAPVSARDVAAGSKALAALLRQLRTERGLGTQRLAEGACVARSTVQRLERGQLRPRPSTLARIAGALDPDRRAEIRDQLVAAAGESIAVDSPGWSRYAAARVGEALGEGRIPFPAAQARAVRLSVASEAMFAMSMRLNDAAVAATGARFWEMVKLHDALSAESERLREDAGGIWRAVPPRRHRGDPPDVSPFPPPLDDLPAVWRWLWEWQVREGRLRPRSARERAIAATGERERLKVRDAPPATRTVTQLVEGAR